MDREGAHRVRRVYRWTEREHTEFADFNTCVYRLRVSRLRASAPLASSTPPWTTRTRQPRRVTPKAFVRQAPVAVWKKGAAPAPTNAARWRQVRLAAQGDVQEGHQRRGEQSGGGRPKTSRLDVGEDSRTIRDVGNKVFECLDAFCRSHPEAAKAAEGYGTPDFHLEGVAEWRQALEKHFKLEDTKPALDLKGLLEYKTPVNVNLLEAWAKSAGDPDEEVASWLRTGAPLGANLPIRTRGIFPAKEDDDSKSYKASVAAQEWAKLNNYKSFTDNQKDSDVEMERLVSLGYVKKLTTQEAERYFSHPVVSKLRHIVKEKPDGSKKRRVIVDALRSGANSQAVCPERIVLPRQQNVATLRRCAQFSS